MSIPYNLCWSCATRFDVRLERINRNCGAVLRRTGEGARTYVSRQGSTLD